MRKLICRAGQRAGQEILLNEGLNRIGRNPANEIAIPDACVSSFHCELSVAEIAVAVRDLNSTNGTFINGVQITKGILHSGDILMLGEIQLVVELPEVHIGLPTIPKFEPTGAAFLEDGSPGCFNHRETPALFRCTRCENWWCGECVRPMKRLNGTFLEFCPECSGSCEAIPSGIAARKTFLERVADTLRLPRPR